MPSPTRGSRTPISVSARTASRSELRDSPRRWRELLLLRELRVRGELAGHDQVLDLRDRLISQRDHGLSPVVAWCGVGRVADPVEAGGGVLQYAARAARSPGDGSDDPDGLAPDLLVVAVQEGRRASRCRTRGGRGRSTRPRPRRPLRRSVRVQSARRAIVLRPEILAATLACAAARAEQRRPVVHPLGARAAACRGGRSRS